MLRHAEFYLLAGAVFFVLYWAARGILWLVG